MLTRLRSIGLIVSAVALGCTPSVDVDATAGSADTSTTSAGAGGAPNTTSAGGSGGAMLSDPGVRLSQGEPCCSIHDGKGTCCDKPDPDPGSVGPWEIFGVDDAVEVAYLGDHACVRRANGKVACWGWNTAGQLGLAGDVGASIKHPTDLPGVQVDRLAGGGHTTCGIEPSGQAICWGNIGIFSSDPATGAGQTPVPVPGAPHAVDIALSASEGAVVLADGSVLHWGNAEAPLAMVPGITDAVKVAVCSTWDKHPPTCALRANGTVVCWTNITPVTPVADLAGVVQLSGAEYGNLCARTGDGRVVCLTNYVAPGVINVTPLDIHDAIDVSAGNKGVCAVRQNGSIACWDYSGNPTPFPPT